MRLHRIKGRDTVQAKKPEHFLAHATSDVLEIAALKHHRAQSEQTSVFRLAAGVQPQTPRVVCITEIRRRAVRKQRLHEECGHTLQRGERRRRERSAVCRQKRVNQVIVVEKKPVIGDAALGMDVVSSDLLPDGVLEKLHAGRQPAPAVTAFEKQAAGNQRRGFADEMRVRESAGGKVLFDKAHVLRQRRGEPTPEPIVAGVGIERVRENPSNGPGADLERADPLDTALIRIRIDPIVDLRDDFAGETGIVGEPRRLAESEEVLMFVELPRELDVTQPTSPAIDDVRRKTMLPVAAGNRITAPCDGRAMIHRVSEHREPMVCRAGRFPYLSADRVVTEPIAVRTD
ncbi:MAG TPA: hypothetical protein VIW45_14790 [Vicinamibacterales bacterium]